jgi:hypothetical protein
MFSVGSGDKEAIHADLLAGWDAPRAQPVGPDRPGLGRVDRIAVPALVVPAGSMSVERLFSLAGSILSVRRMRLKVQARKELQLVAANIHIFADNVERTGELRPSKIIFPWGRTPLVGRLLC